MKFNGHSYTSCNLGKDFIFDMMWHTSPSRSLDVTKTDDVILAVNNAYRDMMPRTITGLGLSNLDKITTKSIKSGNKDEKALLFKQKDELKNTKKYLLKELKIQLAKNIIDNVFLANNGSGDFNDDIHSKLCNGFITDFTNCINTLNNAIRAFNDNEIIPKNLHLIEIDPKTITYGKAQKIVNMTMKQLYCFDNAEKYKSAVFESCHIPIDSIILEFFGLSYTWSNLKEDSYSDVQKACKEMWDAKTSNAGITGEFTKLFFAEFIIWYAKKSLDKTIGTLDIAP